MMMQAAAEAASYGDVAGIACFIGRVRRRCRRRRHVRWGGRGCCAVAAGEERQICREAAWEDCVLTALSYKTSDSLYVTLP